MLVPCILEFDHCSGEQDFRGEFEEKEAKLGHLGIHLYVVVATNLLSSYSRAKRYHSSLSRSVFLSLLTPL